MKIKNLKYKQGFTLIEILIVIALIAVLAAITILAINPQQAFQNARNTQRRSDISQILNAITQYISQGNALASLGTINPCDPGPASIIGTGLPQDGTYLDLEGTTPIDQLTETYIVSIPNDPTIGSAENTGYTICTTEGGRVRIESIGAEGGVSLIVER